MKLTIFSALISLAAIFATPVAAQQIGITGACDDMLCAFDFAGDANAAGELGPAESPTFSFTIDAGGISFPANASQPTTLLQGAFVNDPAAPGFYNIGEKNNRFRIEFGAFDANTGVGEFVLLYRLGRNNFTPVLDLEGGAIGGNYTVSAVPLPAAAWLFGSALLALVGVGRRRRRVATGTAFS